MLLTILAKLPDTTELEYIIVAIKFKFDGRQMCEG